jgi:hypothetical protein
MEADYDMLYAGTLPKDTEMALQAAENEFLMGGQALRFVHQWLLTENELMV